MLHEVQSLESMGDAVSGNHESRPLNNRWDSRRDSATGIPAGKNLLIPDYDCKPPSIAAILTADFEFRK